ncbi:MAG: AAA family ATPase [bacterium]|nr:AAA family ATPase [bacterium]
MKQGMVRTRRKAGFNMYTDFQIIENIYKNRETDVFRAIRESDGLPVILKVRDGLIAAEPEMGLPHEFELGKTLRCDRSVKHLALEQSAGKTMLLLQDDKMNSLEPWIPDGGFEILPFLTLAVEITAAIEELHAQDVIHKDINPANIIVNTAFNAVKLIDFGLATRISEEVVGFEAPAVLQGTVSYISPEQTGRINKPVDSRSDLYSLGVTLYRLITGNLPFNTTKPGELIYSHIAKIPAPVTQIRRDVPTAISLVIEKLLKKSPAERYQTAAGAKRDLIYLKDTISAAKKLYNFSPGKREHNDKITLLHKLYGREKETAQLLQCFSESSQKGQVVTVTGPAGIGKTALIRELYAPITTRRGFFLAGKFDQMNKGTAYTAFIDALEDFVHQCLGQENKKIKTWRTGVQTSVGKFGQVLTDIVPEFENLIGKQPDIAPVSPIETVRRRNMVFPKLIGDICAKGHPLVIFLDDLQWADSATLSLLKTIIGLNPGNLLLILSYRDNEISASHPAKFFLENLDNKTTALTHLHLDSLTPEAVKRWMSDILPENRTAEELATLVSAKTEGNPFYITSFLHLIIEKGYIKREPGGTLSLDMAAVTKIPADSDVVEHLIRKIKNLEERDRDFLTRISILGNRFSMETIRLYLAKKPEAYLEAIQELVRAHLLVKSGEYLMFAHDRVQQAARSLLDEKTARALHLQAGQNIMAAFQAGSSAVGNIEEFLYHYNAAADLITNKDRRWELAKLNILQGKRLKSNAAYQAAENSFAQAIALMPEEPFETEYKLAINLYTEYGEILFLNLKYEEGEKQFDTVITHSKSPQDSAKVYIKQIAHYGAHDNPKKSMKIALHALETLGIKLHKKMLKIMGIVDLLMVKRLLKNKKPGDILDFPVTKDPLVLIQMEVLAAATASAYTTYPQYFLTVVSHMLRLSVKSGNSPLSPFAYETYALIQCHLGNAETGEAYGKIALELMEKLEAKQLYSKIPWMFGFMIHHWKAPARDCIPYFDTAIAKGLESGDYEYASYAISNSRPFLFYTGKSIYSLLKRYPKQLELLAGFNKKSSTFLEKYFHCFLVTMNTPGGDGITLIGDIIDEKKLSTLLEERQDLYIMGIYKIGKMQLAYMAGDYERAAEVRPHALELLKALTASIFNPACHFYSALTCIAYYRKHRKKNSLLREAKGSLKKLKKWAANAPHNYLHKAQLVEAELLAVKGKQQKALQLYEAAIKNARNAEHNPDLATAYECMGRYLLETGLETLGLKQIRSSITLFLNWGALNKSDRLTKEFDIKIISENPPPATTGTTSSAINAIVDLEALATSIKSLTGDLKFDSLLGTLLDTVMQNSGATRVIYINVEPQETVKPGNLQVRAEKLINGNVRIFEGKNIEPEQFALPLALLEECAAGTREYVLENKRTKKEPNGKTKQEHRQESLLVIPLKRNQSLKGLVYLENTLMEDAFRESHVQFLSLLAGQAAVAIENALVFENLDAEREYSTSIIQNAPTLICGIDSDGLTTFINPVIEKITGYRKDELIGKNWWQLFYPGKEYEQVERLFKKFAEGEVADYEMILTCKDGSRKHVAWNSFSRKAKDGKVETVRVGNDITPLKQHEAELQHLRNYLSNIIDSMPSVLVGVDNNSNVTLWNKRAEQITGVTAKAALGKNIREVFPRMETETDKITESISTRKIKKETQKPRQTDAGVRYEDVTIYPLIVDGFEGAVIRIDDVSKEHKLQLQLNHSSKMDAIGHLAGGVAHDFNNMLGGILGAAQLLLKLEKDNIDESNVEFLEMIIQASTRASDLTSKLLAFGRKGKLSSSTVQIHHIIDDTATLLNRTIDKKIQLKVKKGAQNDSVVGDNSGLQNALLNISINASHAMPGGGEIQIETKNIHLNKTYCEVHPFEIEPGEYIEIDIRDTGCGIPLEDLKKIFEPFYTTKEQGKGTGLGLAAVYGTVQDHRGAVNVYSEVGEGTSFRVLLPCSQVKTVATQGDEEVMPGSGQILLVDDEEIIRVTGKRMLEEMGYRVLLAQNGREAVEIFQKRHTKIDLVLMDMIMPDKNGREAFSEMRVIDKRCKVVISSGFTKNENLDELREAGLAGFIHKPYRDYELSKLLAKLLKKHTQDG